MDEEELRRGFDTLDHLSKSEYHESLNDLVKGTAGPFGPSLQIGRLIVVILKEPFATSVNLPSQSQNTGAFRGWELVDEVTFNELSRKGSWQYQVLQLLAKDEGRGDAYQLAVDAHYERGFFGYLARSSAKYICGDAKIRREVKKAVDAARKAGMDITIKSPDVVVGSAGLSLGVLLIQYVPILGFVGAPVIAGFVLILYRIGVDAFCDWSRDSRVNSPVERR